MVDTLATILSDTRVLLEVGDAMAQDIDGFGVHYLPDGTGPAHVPNITGALAVARARRHALDRDGTTTWADLIALAHLEVLAETDPAALRDRLIQSAALHALWVSALDRAHADDPEYAAAHINRVVLPPQTTTEEQSHE